MDSMAKARDLIYRDDAEKAIDGMKPALGNIAQEIMKAMCGAAVATIPKSVDAVEVVRCKDCANCFELAETDPLTPYCGGADGFFCTAFDMDFYTPHYDASTYYCAEGKAR